MRQGPLWIVEPPLNTGEQMSVNDPQETLDVPGSGRSRCGRADLCGLAYRLGSPANVLNPGKTRFTLEHCCLRFGGKIVRRSRCTRYDVWPW